jgi:hypothetical protein
VADIHAMFELLTGQHKNKELQNVFNATPELRNKPTEIISGIKNNTNLQLILFLCGYECKPATKEHIRELL